MANFFANLGGGILNVLGKANTAINAAPGVLTALGSLLAALERPVCDLAAVKSQPLNIALDVQTARDLQAVWPEIKKFMSAVGVK